MVLTKKYFQMLHNVLKPKAIYLVISFLTNYHNYPHLTQVTFSKEHDSFLLLQRTGNLYFKCHISKNIWIISSAHFYLFLSGNISSRNKIKSVWIGRKMLIAFVTRSEVEKQFEKEKQKKSCCWCFSKCRTIVDIDPTQIEILYCL